ncbi:ATP-binding protein [Zavarzinia compransoris]|uniref:histidine kinase n=1 Tax=Zavarzinia compransoris TaxID=1264899 RepID=A0A317DW01_9PROT|nr:ATP-binding protein [Zavarzinia compransoris]PWR18887.1 hypothetical protein DKG75_18105 [Zavarzinia compransoris]TDP48882.1 signal transduction histidine kinase [Zavarzinia compransoris]
MRRRFSLAGQTLRALIVANLLALGVISAGFILSGLSDRKDRRDEILEHMASDLGDALGFDGAGRLVLDHDADDWHERLEKDRSLQFLAFDPASGSWLAGSSAVLRAAIGDTWLRDWRQSRLALSLPDGTPLHGAIMTVSVDGRPLRVAIARADSTWDDTLSWAGEELTEEIAPSAVPALLLSLVVAYIAIRRAMRPVKAATARLGALDPTQAGDRLDEDRVPREIAPLVAAVNAAFDRVAASFAKERRFLADAAHELKTPIAVLRARIDSLADRATAERLGADIDRLGRIVDRLLTSARLEQAALRAAPLDLAALARDVVAECAPLALAGGREIALEAPPHPVAVEGDAAALAEALRNLINNALRFTPAGSAVEVTVAEAAGATVTVADRGPGLPDGLSDSVFTPFVSSEASGSGHAGLGLAIVAAVARRHQGRIEAANRAGGGAEFRLHLPRRLSAGGAGDRG